MHSRHAVIIPVYQPDLSAQELFSIRNTVTKLSEHDIYIVGPEHLSACMTELCATFTRPLQYQSFPDRFFASIDSYNQLLVSKIFYQKFTAYQYVLIVQTDALVLKDALNEWCSKGYSYIGAPWFEGYTIPILPLRLMGVGNGGFSLRHVPDFLRVLNRPRIFKNKLMESWPGSWVSNTYRYLKDYHSFVFGNIQMNLHVNEDLFWGMFVPRHCAFFTVPAPAEAVNFAFEAHPDFLYELNHHVLPFGCHAWERYGSAFWLDMLAQHGFDLTELRAAVEGTSTPER